ncbi:MAG: FeoA family protein [Myxococcota bacterium]
MERALSALKEQEQGVVSRLEFPEPMRRRMLALGFVPGSMVRVNRTAPLGDPVQYEVRGSIICLRRSEAQHIHVTLPK